MAGYYPSEIARLVLGYLKEANCPKTWETFLVECLDLQEHKQLLQSGSWCSTNIEGKSLLKILQEYCCYKNSAEEYARIETNLIYSWPEPNYNNLNQYASENCTPNSQTSDIVLQNFPTSEETSLSFTEVSADAPSGLPSRSNPYRTLYSQRQAHHLQLENHRSPFQQTPNVNNCQSSTYRSDSKRITTDSSSSGSENSFPIEMLISDYLNKIHEHKHLPSTSNKTGYQDIESEKPKTSHKSSDRNASKYESSVSTFQLCEKKFGYQNSSFKCGEKERTRLSKKSNSVNDKHNKSFVQNSVIVDWLGKSKRNISTLKKSDENFHKEASDNGLEDEERTFNNKNFSSKGKCFNAGNKPKSSNNLVDENILPSVSEKNNLLSEKDSTRLPSESLLASKFSYEKDRDKTGTLSKDMHPTLVQKSQLGISTRMVDNGENAEVGMEKSNINVDNIFDEVVDSTSQTSTDQDELDQAAAFSTKHQNRESQEPEISSQNITGENKGTLDTKVKDSDTLVTKQVSTAARRKNQIFRPSMSKAAGHKVPMWFKKISSKQSQEISNLLDRIKEIGLENVADAITNEK